MKTINKIKKIVFYGAVFVGFFVCFGHTNSILAATAQIDTGQNFTCSLSEDGNVYCWGDNNRGQLGDNTTVDKLTPVQVLKGAAVAGDNDGTYLTNIKSISVGDEHVCALSNNNNIYCWGGNVDSVFASGQGQLGDGTYVSKSTPVRVVKGAAVAGDNDGTYLTNIKSISAGYGVTCAVSNNDNPYCWGSNAYNELGLGASGLFCDGEGCWGTANTNTPVRVHGVSDSGFLSSIGNIVVGSQKTCAFSLAGLAYCWGNFDNTNPIQVLKGAAVAGDNDGTYLTNVKSMSLLIDHVCVLTNLDNPYCWSGSNAYGQLGDNTNAGGKTSPVRVLKGAAVAGDNDGTYLTNIKSISAGQNFTCAVSNNNNPYCWGSNNQGDLGDSSSTNRYTPVRALKGAAVAGDNDGTYLTNIKSISAGFVFTCAVSNNNNPYCWGSNVYGQFGDNTTTGVNTAVRVHGVADSGYLSLAAAVSTITISGSLYASDETTPVTSGTVKMSIAGGTATTTPVDGSGNWSFIGLTQPTAGQVITIWMDAGSTLGTSNASLIFKYGTVCEGGTTSCTGLKLYRANTIIGVDYNNTANTITNTDLSACDNDTGTGCADTDIGFTSNSGTLTATWTTSTLRIKDANAKFAPGGIVSIKSFNQSNGQFNGGSAAITLNANYTLSGGTFTSTSGLLTVYPTLDISNWVSSGGTFNHNSGTVKFYGYYGFAVTPGSISFNNVIRDSNGCCDNLVITGDMQIYGTVTITAGNFSNGTTTVYGNVVTTTTRAGGGKMVFSGSGTQTLSAGGGNGWISSVEINKSGGSLTLQDTIKIQSSSDSSVWTYTLGTVNPGSSTIYLSGNYNWSINSGLMSFNNVEIYSEGCCNSMTISGNLDINGNLAYTGIKSTSGGSITLAGNYSHTGNGGLSTPITIDGTGAQTITQSAGTIGGLFTINKPSGTVTLASNLTLGGALTITSGTLDQGATYNLTTGGALTLGASGILSNSGTGDLTLGGNVSNAGNITMNGGGASCGDADGIAITAASARTWSGAGTFNLTDVALTNQTASVPITIYSGTNTSGNTGSWTWSGCPVLSTISGSLYASDETTPVTSGTVKMSIAGGTATTTPVDGSGNWSFIGLTQPTAGQVITLWTDGGSDRASLIFKYGSTCEGGTTDCVGLSLYKDNVIIGVNYNDTLSTTTISDLASCDNDTGTGCADTDIGFTANGGTLTTTWATNTLRIKDANAKFSPGGTMTVSGFKQSGGVFSGFTGWYNSSWSYRKAITIDNTKVSGSADLSGFPVLIDLTDAGLSANAQADGDDILFTSSDGMTKLNHEIEVYNSSTGKLTAWASTTLDFDNDTVIYMYYGNSGATNQQNSTGVWSSGYKGVWHLPNGTSLTANDSTSNGKTGTINSATATSSVVYGGAGFNGNLSVNITIPATTLGYTNLTVSGWVKVTTQTCGGSYRGLVSKNGFADFVLAMQCASGNVAFYASGGGGGSGTILSTTSLGDGIWHYVNATCDGSFCRVYVDGGAAEASVGFAANVYDNAVSTTFGKYSNDTQVALDGGLDEIRISSVARSVDWINTEYSNQSATSTFYTVGTQESMANLNLYGPLTITGGTFTSTGGNINFTGDVAQTITKSGGTVTLGPVVINKTNNSDTVTLASNLTLSDTLTVTKGLFSQGAIYNLTTGGLLTVSSNGTLQNTGTGDLTLGGNVSNAGTITMNSNNGAQCVDGVNDIAITSTVGGTQRTWSGAGTFTIYNAAVTDMLDGAITISAYNSTLSNSDWTVGGGCVVVSHGGGGSSVESSSGGGSVQTGGGAGGGGGSSENPSGGGGTLQSGGAVLSVHSSSPARVTSLSTTITTAPFDPPANSLILVMFSGDGGGVNNLTMTNSGTVLSWTQEVIKDDTTGGRAGQIIIKWAVLTEARTGMTVTATRQSNNDLSMKVYVVNGYDQADPIGASGSGGTTTNNITPTVFTSTAANSIVFAVYNDYNATEAITTSSDLTTVHNYYVASQMSGLAGYKTLGSSGSTVTVNFDGGGTAIVEANWGAVEVKPGSSGPVSQGGGGGAAAP